MSGFEDFHSYGQVSSRSKNTHTQVTMERSKKQTGRPHACAGLDTRYCATGSSRETTAYTQNVSFHLERFTNINASPCMVLMKSERSSRTPTTNANEQIQKPRTVRSAQPHILCKLAQLTRKRPLKSERSTRSPISPWLILWRILGPSG